MRAALVAFALIPGLAPAELAAADCAPAVLAPALITHGGDPLPADGGVLVGWNQSGEWKQGVELADPADNATWRFRHGKKSIKPKRVTIAPGLVRYDVGTKLKRTRRGTKVKLGSLGTFVARSRAKIADFAATAPAVDGISVKTVPGRRGDITTATVVLAAAPPADAYGLVLYDVDGSSATPISWVTVWASTQTSFEIFQSPGGCGMNPPGMRAPLTGDDVSFAWVDRFGRVSPRSMSVLVK